MSRVAQQALFASASSPAAISYIGLTAVPEDADGSVTVANVAIGAAATDRIVFIVVSWYSAVAPSFSAATIGGVAATVHVNIRGTGHFGANTMGSAIISAAVPTGTTATVTLTFSGDVIPYLGVYRVTGLVSRTPGDTISAAPSTVQPYSGAIDVTNQGVMLFGGIVTSGATGYTVSGATTDFVSAIGNNQHVIGSSLNVAATEVNRAVSITRTGGSGTTFNGAIVAVALR